MTDNLNPMHANTTRTGWLGQKLVAAGWHFLASFLVLLVFFWLLLFLWYPTPYFSASGGWQGLRLVIAVDLVLGPVLTFIVYNKLKSRRELLMDLSLIVLIQVSALAWGIYTVHRERPVAVVFWDTSFYTVPAKALRTQGIELDQLRVFGDSFPVYIYGQPADTDEARERMLELVLQHRIPPHEQLERYRPLADYMPAVIPHQRDVDEIMRSNPKMGESVERIAAEHGSTPQDHYHIPLRSRYRNILLVFDEDFQRIGSVIGPAVAN